jgi:hypothetical protein
MHWPHWLPSAAQSQQHQQPVRTALMFVSASLWMTVIAAVMIVVGATIAVAVMIAHRAMRHHHAVVARRVWLKISRAIWAFAAPALWMLRRAALLSPALIAVAQIGLFSQTSVVARFFAANRQSLSIKKKNPLWPCQGDFLLRSSI